MVDREAIGRACRLSLGEPVDAPDIGQRRDGAHDSLQHEPQLAGKARRKFLEVVMSSRYQHQHHGQGMRLPRQGVQVPSLIAPDRKGLQVAAARAGIGAWLSHSSRFWKARRLERLDLDLAVERKELVLRQLPDRQALTDRQAAQLWAELRFVRHRA